MKAFIWCDVRCVTLQHHVAMRYAKGKELVMFETLIRPHNTIFQLATCLSYGMCRKKHHPTNLRGTSTSHFSWWDDLCIDLSHRSGSIAATPRLSPFIVGPAQIEFVRAFLRSWETARFLEQMEETTFCTFFRVAEAVFFFWKMDQVQGVWFQRQCMICNPLE